MPQQRVLVTGGSGFIAGHCIVQLLEQGYQVRSTVRSLSREAPVRAVLAEAGMARGDALSFVAADLTSDAGWADAVTGVDAYGKSKTLAERAAWDFTAREGGSMELVTILPVAVLGPVLGRDVSGANHLVQAILNGEMPGFPRLYIPVVDVRDVAAVFRAQFRPTVPDLGYVKKLSSEKAVRVLGWRPRDPELAIVAAGESMVGKGLVKN